MLPVRAGIVVLVLSVLRSSDFCDLFFGSFVLLELLLVRQSFTVFACGFSKGGAEAESENFFGRVIHSDVR
jgi:hypothetical protein